MSIQTACTQMISVIKNNQIYRFLAQNDIIYHLQLNLWVNDQAYFDAFLQVQSSSIPKLCNEPSNI